MSKENNEQQSGLSRREVLLSAAGVAAVGALGTAGTSSEARAADGERIVVNGLDASSATGDFIGLLKEGGVHCVHKSTGDLSTIAAYYGLAYEHSDEITITTTVADIHAARAEGKIAFVLGSQVANNHQAALFSGGFGVLGSFDSMNTMTRNLKVLGIGIQGLCYNTTNVFGSGCLDHK